MARSKSTRWYAALVVLLAFILLAWLLGAVLTLTDSERVALRVGLVWWVIGMALASAYFFIIYRMFRGKVSLEGGGYGH